MMHRRLLILVCAAIVAGNAAIAWSKPAARDVSIRFSSTPIPVVLRALAEQVGFDLVVGPGIEAEVDVNLNGVPWETALDAVAASHGLSYQWRDDVLVVLPGGEGNGFLTHQVVTLRYANPLAVKTVLATVLRSPAKVELLQAVTTGTTAATATPPPVLVISESPQAMPALLALIDSLDVERPQFEIEVKFVETTLDDKMDVGFNWPTRVSATLSSREVSGTTTETDQLKPAAEYDIPDGKIWKFGTLSIDQLTGFLDLLKQNGKSKLLSDPRVTVVESERAVMRVATTIPVQTLNRFSEGGTIQDIVSFQDLDVGITLAVTPRLNENGLMTLDVEPVVEEITGFTGPADNQRPITSKRTVRTTVRVKDNETVVIGGLVRENDISTKSKLFLLGDLPLLGGLFTHHKTQKQKTDLLIFITPRLITPMAAN
jgi:type II secretory pathway component GspD/PulD (secretin)